MVLFSPDFKYKLDSFILYIIDNYAKRTIGRCTYRELSKATVTHKFFCIDATLLCEFESDYIWINEFE